MTIELSGVFPVLPTIFNDRGALDAGGLAEVIEFAIARGVAGVVFPGLASEYDVLTLEERLDLIALVGRRVGGRVRFIVGAGSDRVEDSARLAQSGAEAGADAAMVMTPRAFAGDRPGLRQFYAELGKRSGLPLMLQNAPSPMGLGLSSADVREVVAAVEEIRWIKEENMPCGQRISEMLAVRPPNLLGVLGGAGGRYVADELARGSLGTMPAVETPEMHVALFEAHLAGDERRVRELYEAVLPILLMQATFRWRLTKEVLRRRGVIASAFTRANGPEFDRGDHLELSRILDRLEVSPAKVTCRGAGEGADEPQRHTATR